MKVFKIVVPIDIPDDDAHQVFFDFQQNSKWNLCNHILTLDSEDLKSEYIYLFGCNEMLSVFIECLLENDVPIFSVKDYTADLIQIISQNKVHEYLNLFNEDFEDNKHLLIEKFIHENITVDMVLDKIYEKGMLTLNEYEHIILKTATEGLSTNAA